MDLVKIERIVSRQMKKLKARDCRENGYTYYHGKRVGELAIRILKSVEPAVEQNVLDLLSIAAMVHDIGKGKKHHAVVGAKMLPKLLGSELAEIEMAEVQRMVEEHNLREMPNECLPDSKALQDADVLDHFGAQGIWLGIYYTARNRGGQADMLEYFTGQEHQEYVDEKYAGLNFDISKEIFDKRYEYQKSYVKLMSQM